MMRKLMGTMAVAVILCASVVLADEVKGKVMKVDEDGMKITISVDGKETEYMVAKDAKMPTMKGKDGSEKTMDLKGLAKALDRAKAKDRDLKVTATTEKKDGHETITELKMEARGKGKNP
jgi:hypothetical protein